MEKQIFSKGTSMIIENGKRLPTVTDTSILGFFEEYRFLSNFHPAKITIDGITYKTSEHAYMAAKSDDVSIKLLIRDCVSPKDARNVGQKINLITDWDILHKPIAMYEVLIYKFQNKELREMLLATGTKYLEETNNWGDVYWGVDTQKGGKNMLGKTLMLVRDHYAK